MKIGRHEVGNEPLIIADACNNHLGDMTDAKTMVAAASQRGAHYIKFQLGRNLPLKARDMERLKRYADDWNIDFLCTAFDKTSADEIEDLVTAYKVGSAECVDFHYLDHILSKDKPVIISTGGTNLEDVAEIVDFLDEDQYVLMHCTSIYPTPYDKVNLDLIPYYHSIGIEHVGLSDHTPDIYSCLGGVAKGACVLEKHFTLNKHNGSADAKVSVNPEELGYLVKGASIIYQALGNQKTFYPEEQAVMRRFR